TKSPTGSGIDSGCLQTPGNPDFPYECVHCYRVGKPAVAPWLPNGAKPSATHFRRRSRRLARTHRRYCRRLDHHRRLLQATVRAPSAVLGRKRMLVLGALFFAGPPFLYPLIHDPWSLLALRFVHGFATAIFSPVASAYVAGLGETGRGARLGW